MNNLFKNLDKVARVLAYINIVISVVLLYAFFNGSVTGESLTFSVALTYMCCTTSFMKGMRKYPLVLASQCVAIGAMLWTSPSVISTCISIAFSVCVVLQVAQIYLDKKQNVAV